MQSFSCGCGTSKWPVVVSTGSALSVLVQIPVFFDGWLSTVVHGCTLSSFMLKTPVYTFEALIYSEDAWEMHLYYTSRSLYWIKTPMAYKDVHSRTGPFNNKLGRYFFISCLTIMLLWPLTVTIHADTWFTWSFLLSIVVILEQLELRVGMAWTVILDSAILEPCDTAVVVVWATELATCCNRVYSIEKETMYRWIWQGKGLKFAGSSHGP